MDIDDIKNALFESNPDAITFDDLDSALLGVGNIHAETARAVYSEKKIIDHLMKVNKWSSDEAQEYYEFNIACLGITNGTPIIIQDNG
jgi:hypothetical protein